MTDPAPPVQERLSDEKLNALIDWCKRASTSIYIAVEASVADDISRHLKEVVTELQSRRSDAGTGSREYLTVEGITEQAIMDALADENEELIRLLERCRAVLGNMAAENNPVCFGFQRWKIHHEPLRADAKNLLPDIVLALDDTHAARSKGLLRGGQDVRRPRA